MTTHSNGESFSESRKMLEVALNALEEAKGEDIRVLNVSNLTDVTDYMIIASGTSDRHNKTLANRVLEDMHEVGWAHLGVEGEAVKEWILVDFVDVVIHIMRAQTRKHYDLESLWDENLSHVLKSSESIEADEAVRAIHALRSG
ncbi:MAG: ribosome silencing factor [Pseudomonadota bacterium]